MYNWVITKDRDAVSVTRIDRKTGEGFYAIEAKKEDDGLLYAILSVCRVGDLILFSDRKVALVGRRGATA